ncbi:hypothetical protein PM082_022144 [Marasmius tenuissimus]|nr:hypothetical protein PM082_022144 [Marasmius tenuissimus]
MDKDEQFINGIAREFVIRQRDKIAKMVRQHNSSNSSSVVDRVTPSREKCVAVLDLNTSEIPSIQRQGSFTLYSSQRAFKEGVGDRKIDDSRGVLESVWSRTPVSKRGLLIVILVPKLRNVSLAIMARFEAKW